MLSHPRYGVFTEPQLSLAMHSFHSRPDLIDTVVGKLSDMPRDEAEHWARMMSMSASICVAAGITAEQDMARFGDPDWQGLLEVLLESYDRTDKDTL